MFILHKKLLDCSIASTPIEKTIALLANMHAPIIGPIIWEFSWEISLDATQTYLGITFVNCYISCFI